MWVVAVAAWVAIVIAGSGVTWLAIDRAGQQVSSNPLSSVPTQPIVVGTVGPAPKSSAKPSRTPSRTATPTAVPTGSTSTSATTTSRPTSRPSAHDTSSAPLAHTETRTWSGAPGSLTVSCTGQQARLKGATPSDGWSVERGDTSGDNIEVKFENGESEVQVRATCVDGVPRFQAESSTSGTSGTTGGDG